MDGRVIPWWAVTVARGLAAGLLLLLLAQLAGTVLFKDHYIYTSLFMAVWAAPAVAQHVLFPWLISPRRPWTPRYVALPGSPLAVVVPTLMLAAYLYAVNLWACRLVLLRYCGRDVPAVSRVFAARLTSFTFAIAMTMTFLPILTAYLHGLHVVPFWRETAKGLPMALVAALVLRFRFRDAMVKAACGRKL